MRKFDSASQARSAAYGQASAGPLCGLEMAGALGNDHRFGFDWNAQQRYLGAVFMYASLPAGPCVLNPRLASPTSATASCFARG